MHNKIKQSNIHCHCRLVHHHKVLNNQFLKRVIIFHHKILKCKATSSQLKEDIHLLRIWHISNTFNQWLIMKNTVCIPNKIVFIILKQIIINYSLKEFIRKVEMIKASRLTHTEVILLHQISKKR